MRTEQAQAKKGSKNAVLGALGCLALVVGGILSMGDASAQHATTFVEGGRPEASAADPAAPGRVSPADADAERDMLELQLD